MRALALLFISWVLLLMLRGGEGGVSGLTKHFRTRHKAAWFEAGSKKAAPFLAEHVCIDMNQILHSSLRLAVTDPKFFMARIFTELDALLRIVHPTRSFVLAFDGPAPFAKMQTQRNRRSSSPDNSIITPGTDIMNAMESIMICYVIQRVQRKSFENLTVFISGASCPGEGELKIVEWVNSHMPDHNETLVICGSDSDILLQAVGLPHVPNAFVLQARSDYPDAFCNVSRVCEELKEYAGLTKIKLMSKSIGSGKDGKGGNYSSSNRAHRYEEEEEGENAELMSSSERDREDIAAPASFRLDMIVVFVMQGNDYLPKLRGVTIYHLSRAYGNIMRKLPLGQRFLLDLETNNFNFAALWLLMDEVQRLSKQTDESFVALPVQVPTCLQTLHNQIQRQKFTNVTWNETQIVSVDAVTGLTTVKWGTRLDIEGRVFEVEANYPSKRVARQVVAEAALQALDMEAYEIMLDKQARAREKLQGMRDAVMEELNNDASSDVSLSSSSSPVQQKELDSVIFDKEVADELGVNFEGSEETDESGEEDAIMRENDPGSGAIVSANQYLKYVRESDAESYLSGILWVVQMYVDGVCPDLSYSFLGKTPVSPLFIKRYIQKAIVKSQGSKGGASAELIKALEDDCLNSDALIAELARVCSNSAAGDSLRSRIFVPRSSARPLTASATCVCVVPEQGEHFVPMRLKGAWKVMQKTFFRPLEASLTSTTFQDLLDALDKVWPDMSAPNTSQPANSPSTPLLIETIATNKTASAASSQEELHMVGRRNQRRGSRQERVKRGREKVVGRMKKFSEALSDMIEESLGGEEDEEEELSRQKQGRTGEEAEKQQEEPVKMARITTNNSTFVGPLRIQAKDASWVVVTSIEDLKSEGYMSKFRPLFVKLPLKLPFRTPRRLPTGTRTLRTQQLTESPYLTFSSLGTFTRRRSEAALKKKEKRDKAKKPADGSVDKMNKVVSAAAEVMGLAQGDVVASLVTKEGGGGGGPKRRSSKGKSNAASPPVKRWSRSTEPKTTAKPTKSG